MFEGTGDRHNQTHKQTRNNKKKCYITGIFLRHRLPPPRKCGTIFKDFIKTLYNYYDISEFCLHLLLPPPPPLPAPAHMLTCYINAKALNTVSHTIPNGLHNASLKIQIDLANLRFTYDITFSYFYHVDILRCPVFALHKQFNNKFKVLVRTYNVYQSIVDCIIYFSIS